MTRNTKRAVIFASVLLEVALVITMGVPVRWTKGVVVGHGCQPVGEAFACQIELVPDGSRVAAQSDRAMARGSAVKLRGGLDVTSGDVGYTVVD